jgi:Translation initiation factor 2B subunit, eIF-2B alpha/beta/delta family
MNTGLENITSESLKVIGGIKSNPSVLAYSYSSTVLSAILAAKGSGLEPAVICTESRPTLEGKRLTKELRKVDIPVTYIVDMFAFSFMRQGRIDLILVGGDSISTEGLVNKIGTLGLALFAKEFRIPFYALLGTEKFLPSQLMPHFRIESRDPEEVLIKDDDGINVVNQYFDITPVSFLDGVITEAGILKETDIKGRAEGEKVSSQLISWL